MDKLVAHLQLLGFTQYEARVYLALLDNSPVTGYELSKNSGVPASKIYQVLNRLKDKDTVIILDGDPARYVPHPPKEVIHHLRHNYSKSLDELEAGLGRIYTQESESIQYIWNMSGEENITNKINQILLEAQKTVHLSIWEKEYRAIENSLIKISRQSIKIRIVFFGSAQVPVKEVFHHGHEEDIYRQRHGRRLALSVDDAIMMIANFPEEGRATAAWTENKGLVMLTKDYIIHDIYTIKMNKKYGDEVSDLMRTD